MSVERSSRLRGTDLIARIEMNRMLAICSFVVSGDTPCYLLSYTSF